jgi:hypothetical protein
VTRTRPHQRLFLCLYSARIASLLLLASAVCAPSSARAQAPPEAPAPAVTPTPAFTITLDPTSAPESTPAHPPAPPPPPPAPPEWADEKPSAPSSASTSTAPPSRYIGFIPPPHAPGYGELTGVPKNLDLLVLDAGRIPVTPAEPRVLRFQIHGEYQLRYENLRSFPLDPTLSTVAAHPGAIADSLGQNNFVYHWLRLTPRFQITDKVEIVGQIDVLTGMLFGGLAHDDGTDQTPRDSYNGFSNVQPRWLFVEWKSPIGVFRVGQQPSHWGMGILANDGDHPSLFGDYRYGDISERVLFATKPFGRKSDFTVAAMGDLVYRDAEADITQENYAMQGILVAEIERGKNQVGLYGVYRHQWRDQTSEPLASYLETINVGIIDAAGHFAIPVKGTEAVLFGAGEGAVILGSTNEERTLDVPLTQIRSYGGAAAAGVVHVAHCDCTDEKDDARLFGDMVAEVEVGYASGDANPLDDVEHRFTFNPNHKVGLLLFDEVMRFQTARAAVALGDPLLQNSNRPTPGANLLASNGGVFGAEYINPTMVVRPRRWLDLKGGVVIAAASSDVVDPYRLATQGSYVNYLGGSAQSRSLGVELDGGFEVRIPIGHAVTIAVGLESGVLFPGAALANAMGETMRPPWMTLGRVGFFF